ncbi:MULTISPECIES: hypothetical protein [unclassified Crossiella]|uniref:hypothetical protein n=1 Tax=unclassified Crossiella TaxID=2620835 RepID=UPI001FFE79D4|nr:MULTISPECIES: hypothetical protein [unclassified Crossiella]MCK2242149.1 hypothetical protein [Crossiella sp. S99.2]MCK2256052.1 hypothetical protein [Crossiella sp. S99.1]
MSNRPAANPVGVTTSAAVFSGACVYKGVSVRETAGAVASLRIFDGTTAAGTLLAAISLPANGSFAENLPDGVRATTGIYFSVVAGAVEGSVRVG